MDDLRSFNGIVPQYEWECLGEAKIIAPMNTKVKGYPYEKDHNFGPYGLSFANDRWELRDAWVVRMTPKNTDHPYHHKDIYIDKQTLQPALLVRLRPEGGAVEDPLAQPPLERGREPDGRVVPGLGGRAEPARGGGGGRHHRQRADRYGQPHRVLGRARHADAVARARSAASSTSGGSRRGASKRDARAGAERASRGRAGSRPLSRSRARAALRAPGASRSVMRPRRRQRAAPAAPRRAAAC